MRYKAKELGVYCLYVKDNECDVVYYVGVGFLNDRRDYHFSRLRNGKHPVKKIQEIWDTNNGGIEFKELEYCPIKMYEQREDYWINELQPLYNSNKSSKRSYNTNTIKKKKIREHRSVINSGENNPRCRRTIDEIIRIKELVAEGLRDGVIAELFNASSPYINSIRNNHRWASVSLEY